MVTFPSATTFLFGLSLVIGFLGFRHIKNRIDSNSWPKIQSQIDNFVVKKHGGGENSPPFYLVYLDLKYVVEGKSYTYLHATDITGSPKGRIFNKKGMTKEDMLQKAEIQYELNSSFSLYYNPKNPKKASVKIGLDDSTIIIEYILFGVLFFGLFMFIFEYVFGFNYSSSPENINYLALHVLLFLVSLFYSFRIKKNLDKGYKEQGGRKGYSLGQIFEHKVTGLPYRDQNHLSRSSNSVTAYESEEYRQDYTPPPAFIASKSPIAPTTTSSSYSPIPSVQNNSIENREYKTKLHTSCTRCGSMLQSSAKHCPDCGTKR